MHEIKVHVESVSLRVYINWLPLESSGLHAETIKGEMDEKAETVTERVVAGGWRGGDGILLGHMCVTVMHSKEETEITCP